MRKDLNKNSKILIIVVVLNILAMLGWAFFLYRINVVKSEYEENTALLQEEFNRGQSSQALRHLLRETEEERETLRSFFVNDESVVDFLAKVEELGPLSGVSLELVSFQEVEERLELHFQANGTFARMYKFIELAELLPYKLSIGSMEIRKEAGFDQSEVSSQSIWQGSFTLILDSFMPSKD